MVNANSNGCQGRSPICRQQFALSRDSCQLLEAWIVQAASFAQASRALRKLNPEDRVMKETMRRLVRSITLSLRDDHED